MVFIAISVVNVLTQTTNTNTHTVVLHQSVGVPVHQLGLACYFSV